ncbi:hypothetical protein ScPMuIL_009836 [Solemya velum]
MLRNEIIARDRLTRISTGKKSFRQQSNTMQLNTIWITISLCIIFLIETECTLPMGHIGTNVRFSRNTDQDDSDSLDPTLRAEDLQRLLLKKLRFRELEEDEMPVDDLISRRYEPIAKPFYPVSKRQVDDLVTKLSAILAMKGQNRERDDSNPMTRMSSLRFGK